MVGTTHHEFVMYVVHMIWLVQQSILEFPIKGIIRTLTRTQKNKNKNEVNDIIILKS